MKVYSLSAFCLFMIFSCTTTTHYYVVRHAEKTSSVCNSPLLNPEGFQRAATLRDSLLPKNIDSIFVSTCLRTQQTADPLARALGISSPIQFDPGSNQQTDSLIRRLDKIRGKNVLVVGHANTVDSIVRRLSGTSITPIVDSDFDNMFIITVKRPSGSSPQRSLLATTYGVITN